MHLGDIERDPKERHRLDRTSRGLPTSLLDGRYRHATDLIPTSEFRERSHIEKRSRDF
jgi:hypothetical protein